MGKKRNNAAKKKQAAAKKKRLSSAYGVSVLKGGTLARKNGVLDASPSADGKAQAKKQSNAAAASGAGANAISPGQQRDNGSGAGREIPGKRPRDTGSSENDEFRRLHASLEERSLASQARKAEQMRGKKQRKKQQRKGWGGKFAGPSATTNFAPATLTLGPKSTEELMDDAADCVAQGMNEIGQRADISADGAIATEGRSSLAAAASMSWKLRVSNVASETTQQQSQNKNNSFAALEEDSDSDNDNEWGETKSKPPVHPFQFQPASFTFQPSGSSSTAVADDDLDPDL